MLQHYCIILRWKQLKNFIHSDETFDSNRKYCARYNKLLWSPLNRKVKLEYQIDSSSVLSTSSKAAFFTGACLSVGYTAFDKDDELRFGETCKTARGRIRREETSFLRNWDFPRLHVAARCKATSISAPRTWKRKGVKTRSNFSGHWVRRLPSV